MRLEITSAANFLSNLLRLQGNVLSGDQLDVFRSNIVKLLAHHYQHHWFPEKPFKGSGYRCLRINHKMDPIIGRAGSCSGLDEASLRTLFPNELTLWIDPKEVSYRIGENGSICVLYDADSPEEGGPQQAPSNRSSPVTSSTSSLSASPSSSPGSDWFLADRTSPAMPTSGSRGCAASMHAPPPPFAKHGAQTVGFGGQPNGAPLNHLHHHNAVNNAPTWDTFIMDPRNMNVEQIAAYVSS